MSTAKLRRTASKVLAAARAVATVNPILARLRQDPTTPLVALGLEPYPWQADFLASPSRQTLLNVSRQGGKSRVSAARALRRALLWPGSLVLILSPTERQSGELFLKLVEMYRALGEPVPARRLLEGDFILELANGSRVVSLPGKEGTIRCYSSVALLVIDEAARVSDALYYAVRPMLAVSGGSLVALSTPFGRQGWWYDEWKKDPASWGDGEWAREWGGWRRYRVPERCCPSIDPAFLADERASLGDRWYAQEYECFFADMIGAVFSGAEIDALFARPLGGGVPFPD
jgi:hypothetical protein